MGDAGRAENLSQYKICRRGDIVINRMSAYNGAMGVARTDGLVSPDYLVLEPTLGNADFLTYWLKSHEGQFHIRRELKGIGTVGATQVRTPRINEADLRRMRISIINENDQARIADYLDRETAQIDALIAKQQQLITTLRERHMAATERVLLGSDGADKAPTSIAWLRGQSIPHHWRNTSVRHIIRGAAAGKAITADSIEADGPIPVYGGNGVRGYTETSTHVGVRILVGRQGALCGNVHLVDGEFWASEHAIVIEPAEGVDARWLGHMLRLMNLGQYSQTAAQPGIGVATLLPLGIPLPPTKEQIAIAERVDTTASEIDALMSKADQFIRLSKERRAALITAAVTGQIDIPASDS